ALAAAVAEQTGATLGSVTEGPNSAGASLAGVLPHRAAGGKKRAAPGSGVAEMLGSELDVVVLANVEPKADILVTTDVVEKLSNQQFVIALTSYASEDLLEVADLLLPVGTFAETSGTFINVAGTWQSFSGVAKPVGEARPCWKVLRVLGNLTNADGFDYVTSEEVLADFRKSLGDVAAGSYEAGAKIAKPNGADAANREIDTPIYSVDPMVRRAHALQQTLAARRAAKEGEE
ncbi:MAG TPA: molybdopterin-dependent oxidoreductase, partial [Woeseiaceae bacterium]|nr:molybdopterin-dependent oxidoreductase [Woeseiaceae bacterium]